VIRFLLRRVLWGIVTLILFQTLIFFIANVLVPGDWVTQFSQFLTAEQRTELRHQLGLDLPLWEQYVRWLGNFLQGNLGRSMSGVSIVEILKEVMPPTLIVFVPGTLLSFAIGHWLGKIAAWKRGPTSSTATLASILLFTSFPAWLGFLVVYFLGRRLQVYRNMLIPEFSRDLWRNTTMTPGSVIMTMLLTLGAVWLIFFLVNRLLERQWGWKIPSLLLVVPYLGISFGIWYLVGMWKLAADVAYLFTMPLITYVLLSFGETMLITRTNMLDTLKEEYITTARAKGVPEKAVRDKHAARNALLPVLSRFVISLPYLLTGLVIIEYSLGFSGAGSVVRLRSMFANTEMSWHGMGWAFFQALYLQDLPLVMGVLFVVGLLAILARLVIDVLHVLLDPRIRYQTRS
jgi:peptide/nickel transport system permease protein